MNEPSHTSLLSQLNLVKLEDGEKLNPSSDPCACVLHHEPRLWLTERHHVLPLEWGGPDQADNWVNLCPTGHYVVHYHHLMPWVAAGSVSRWVKTETLYLYVVALEGYRRKLGMPFRPIPVGKAALGAMASQGLN